MKQLTQEWLDIADSDLQVAELALAHRGPAAAICFHSQQAAEKCLKALLEERVGSPPRLHSLPQLLAECERLDASLATLRPLARQLNPYSVAARYPGTGIQPTAADALAAVDAAKELRRVIGSLL
jgi:HEPN domain-containing protein